MIKHFFIFTYLLFICNYAHSQNSEPVKWSYNILPQTPNLANNEFNIEFNAQIEEGWYLYSQDNTNEGGPLPTVFLFEETPEIVPIGKVKEIGDLKTVNDPVFDMVVKKYAHKVSFLAKVKTSKPEVKVALPIDYMSCNEEKCKKLNKVFEFTLKQRPNTEPVPPTPNNTNNTINNTPNPKPNSNPTTQNQNFIIAPNPNALTPKNENKPKPNISDKASTEKTNQANAIATTKTTTTVTQTNPASANATSIANDTNNTIKQTPDTTQQISTINTTPQNAQADLANQFKNQIADCGVNKGVEVSGSLLKIFVLGFIGGLAALLTPCVFPMIPLTVSFFTKRSKNKAQGIKNAIIYAVSIIVLYVLLGFLVTTLFGPNILNVLSTDKYFNLAFFAIFVIFAISFFGYFEISLPASFINKVDGASEKGGLIGIFFMAFTLALVSFSCTGPIIGTLLVQAAVEGKQLGPLIGMTGFAVALALPFALFAAFPGWLNSLPKSGGWLNSVKVILGFIELIFALKFFSNADLVEQWGLLKRETFLIIWIILLIMMTLYVLGIIKFPHDSPVKKITAPRAILAATFMAAAIYLVPGIFCNNLSLVSGFPPPVFYSYQCGVSTTNTNQTQHFEGLRDLQAGIEEAKKTGKPLLVDFTGWACVNCRKMEENVWTQAQIAQLMQQYVLVSLYVDEKQKLPENQRFTYELNGNKSLVRTVGDKWSYLETTCFNINSQPYYVLMNSKGQLLNTPVGYTPNSIEYAEFLQTGINKHKKMQ